MGYKVKVNNDFLNLTGDSPDEEVLKALENTVLKLNEIKIKEKKQVKKEDDKGIIK